MKVWTLINHWREDEYSDSLLIGIYATKELAQKAMRDEFNATVNDGTFELKEFSGFATVCDKRNCWVIEEREVKGAPDDGNAGME